MKVLLRGHVIGEAAAACTRAEMAGPGMSGVRGLGQFGVHVLITADRLGLSP